GEREDPDEEVPLDQQGRQDDDAQADTDGDGRDQVAPGPRGPAGRGHHRRRVRGGSGHRSDFEQLGFLVLDQVVDLVDVLVGGVLQLLLGAAHLVLTGLAVARDAVQLLHRLAADVADRDARVLALAARHLHHLASAFLRQLGDDHSDDLPVVARVEPEVGVADRRLEGLELALVVRLDDGQTRLRDGDGGELVDRRHRPVVVDEHPREHVRGGPAGAHGGEVVLRDGDGLLHLLLGVEKRLVDHGVSLPSAYSWVLTRVPILSPRTARAMFPSTSRLNTMIGILLSMQRLNAVASATLSPCSSTSRWVISSYSFASGSTLGSAVDRKSTRLN